MKKVLLIIGALLLGLTGAAQQNDNERPQFTGDSLLFVMVDFPDMQFQHSAAEILNSIADYACNGKRVVGPYHMPSPPSAYSSFESTFLQFSLDVYDSAAADVDMSHFPFDSANANMVIIYPGTIIDMAQQNSLLGTTGAWYGFTGSDKGLYYYVASEKTFFGGDYTESTGTVYAGKYIFQAQYPISGYNFNGYGASIFERAAGGCATIDTLTAAADSIELKVITGHNDKGYYISLSDDEFLLLEAHAMRQGSDAVANDGMYILHGSDSVYDYVHSDYSSIYHREYIPFGAHSYPDTVYYWVDSVDTDWQLPYRGSNSFTPQSYRRPMLFDGTEVDNVWITNIRWKNDSVMLFDFNSDKLQVEILPSTESDIGGLGEMLLQAKIISRTGNVTSKGIVYSLTEAGCNMEQGTVVYDTSASATVIAAHLSGLVNGTTYYYRAFASNGTHTSFSAIKQFEMNKHAALRHASYDALSGKFLLDLELSGSVSRCYYREYMDEMSLIFGTRLFHDYTYGVMYNEWDVIDTTGTILANCHIDTTTNLASFGLWIFTAAGDTLTDMFTFDPAGIDTIQVHIHDEDVESCQVVNGETKLVGKVSWANQQSGRYWVGVAPRSAVYSAFTYYTDDIICNEYDTICDTASQFKLHLNSSFVNHLLANYTFTEVDSTGRVSLPLLSPDSDSTIVLVSIDRYGAAQASEWNTKVGMKADQAVGAAHLGYESYDATGEYEYGYEQTYFTTDSTLRVEIQPNEFANHYYMLEGTASELAALGVTDTVTAVAYRLAHQAEMQRHDCPWLHTGWWDNPSSIRFTTMIDHTYTRTGVLPDSDYHVYLFPFNAAGVPGKVERLVFHIKDKFVDVTPAGNGDTSWWYAENGEVVWAWKYSQIEFLTDYHMYLAPLGHVDSLCTAGNVDYASLLPALIQAGLTRDYGDNMPWVSFYNSVSDTAMHLLFDTVYELCLWATDYDGTVYFQRTPFSTHGAPRFNEAGLKKLYLNREIMYQREDTVFYCFIDATEATAYYHVIFGEEGSLAAQGITSLATASQYSLSHSSALEQYTHQTTEIRFEAGTDDMGYSSEGYTEYEDGQSYWRAYWCWRKHNTHPLSTDSVYRIYVIPYTAGGNQGVGRYIRFTPFYGMYDYSDSAVYGTVTACSATDITETSATLHGDVQAGRRSMSVVGFAYLYIDAPLGTEASTIVVGPYTGETFSYRLTGLQPNTTYRYAVAMGHNTDTTVYSNDIYNNPPQYTFTTARCTVSASIDTTICYNAYYGNHRYTVSQTLEYTYMAANRCDSVLTVNLTVLPQRIGYDTTVLCYGETYNGTSRYTSTTVTETISEAGRCDSTLRMYLRVLPQRIGYDTVVLCYGEEYDGTARYSSVTVSETVTEPNQCDSTIRHRLQVLPQNKTAFRDTLREGSYEWAGEVFTEPGQYTHVFTAANGCDSTVTLTLVAEPEPGPIEGIDDVREAQAELSVDGRTIVVTGAEGLAVTVYDVSGRVIAMRRDGIRFEVPAAGAYLVQVGERPARRVVVVK